MAYKLNGFGSRKFLLALLLITFICTALWFGKVEDPNRAIDFIKWIFIAYCGSNVGEKLTDGLKK